MKRLAVAALSVLALCGANHADAQGFNADSFVLSVVRDFDSSSFDYCNTKGVNGTGTDRNKRGVGVLTAANSTTVTCDGSQGCFTNVAVGDALWINDDGTMIMRGVATRTSANEITVTGAAITVSAAPWEYRTLDCGTADTDGAFSVRGAHSFSIQLILAQENSTSTDYQVECRLLGPGTTWSIVTGPINDSGTFNDVWSTDLAFDECRVGFKVNTDDGGDTGANAEQLTMLVTVRR